MQMDQFQAALDCLHESLDLSLLPSFAGEDRDKADIYGTMADLLTDLGQFEEAAEVRSPASEPPCHAPSSIANLFRHASGKKSFESARFCEARLAVVHWYFAKFSPDACPEKFAIRCMRQVESKLIGHEVPVIGSAHEKAPWGIRLVAVESANLLQCCLTRLMSVIDYRQAALT